MPQAPWDEIPNSADIAKVLPGAQLLFILLPSRPYLVLKGDGNVLCKMEALPSSCCLHVLGLARTLSLASHWDWAALRLTSPAHGGLGKLCEFVFLTQNQASAAFCGGHAQWV